MYLIVCACQVISRFSVPFREFLAVPLSRCPEPVFGASMIVSSWGQIARPPKSAHDHETRSPPGTRAAGRMSGTGWYVPVEIALRDRVPQERPVTIPRYMRQRPRA